MPRQKPGVRPLPAWYDDLMARVQAHLNELQAQEPNERGPLEKEAAELEQQKKGWLLSLGNSQLGSELRTELEAKYEAASRRLQVLRSKIEALAARAEAVQKVLDPEAMQEALAQLRSEIRRSNPARLNLLLMKHIDRIEVYSSSRVEMRGTMLGLFEGAVELLGRTPEEPGSPEDPPVDSTGEETPRIQPRRLLPRAIEGADQDPELRHQAMLSPDRFQGVAPHFFWQETLDLSPPQSWPRTHAKAVTELATEHPRWTLAQIAAHFEKSVGTIKVALKLGGAAPRARGGRRPKKRRPDSSPPPAESP